MDDTKLIYAEDAVEKIRKLIELPVEMRVRAISAVRSTRAIEAKEVVHARWESVQNGKGCCSNCHRLDNIDSLATHCRYCGAEMDNHIE